MTELLCVCVCVCVCDLVLIHNCACANILSTSETVNCYVQGQMKAQVSSVMSEA
jgi:hypothetical protein